MNKSAKRFLSLFLAILMVSVMLVVPAQALDKYDPDKDFYRTYDSKTAPLLLQAKIPDLSYHDNIQGYWTQGRYSISPSFNSSLSLDVEGGSSTSGTNILVCDSHLGSSQDFVIQHVGNGYYVIKHTASGKVLDIANGDSNSGANVLLWDYHGGDNQLWRFVERYGMYAIKSRVGTYLAVSGSNVCTSDSEQYWKLSSVYTNDVRVFPSRVQVKAGNYTAVTVFFRGNNLTGIDISANGYDNGYISQTWGEPWKDEGERYAVRLSIKGRYSTGGRYNDSYEIVGNTWVAHRTLISNYASYYVYGKDNTGASNGLKRYISIAVTP
ncbi:MAG: RICIN domain-containing protein [Oscillibacter sp.]|nr:RICIN domain-containing protein [Oscillibacter sp.]